MKLSTTLAGLLATCVLASPAQADPLRFFSVDPASPAVNGGVTPDDNLLPGPVVAVPGPVLGLEEDFFLGQFDHLNALSFGRDAISRQVIFSVDRVAVGQPGTAVAAQAALGAAAGSLFTNGPNPGQNELFLPPAAFGLTPGFFGDDLAAVGTAPSSPTRAYFSIDLLSYSNLLNPGLSASILTSTGGGVFSVFAPWYSMGLVELDDLDALVLLDRGQIGVLEPGVDQALFSLSTFSATSLIGGISAADVLYTEFTGGFSVYLTAQELGLRPDDELDALDTPIPEPATVAVWALVVGVASVTTRRRFRSACATA